MTDRIPLDHLTSDALDHLYDRLDRIRDAATIHRQGLLRTSELYAAIEEHTDPASDAPLRDQLRAAIKSLATSEAALARIQALADEYPAGIDTALIHEALDQPAPAATEATESAWRAEDHTGHGSPCEQRPDGSCAGPASSPLRDLIADVLLDHLSRTADVRPCRSGGLAFMPEVTDAERMRIADKVATAILPGARITTTLARMADADVQRVITLYEQWVKAGPPPLGTSMARWWDARLAELHDAIHAPTEQPARTTVNRPPALRDRCPHCPDPLCPEDCPECGSPIHDLDAVPAQPAAWTPPPPAASPASAHGCATTATPRRPCGYGGPAA